MIQFKTKHVSAAVLNRTDEINLEKEVPLTEKFECLKHFEEGSWWGEARRGKRTGHWLPLNLDRRALKL